MLRYWNPKRLNTEIEKYGYTFSISVYLKYLLGIYLGIAAFTWVFRLKVPFMLLVMGIVSVFVPGVFLMTYRNLYEEKKFEDLTAYMEQLLYSFKRRAKILTALEDTLLLFQEGESQIYESIERAVLHIRAAETRGDIYEEAFSIIEKEYGCKRLYKIHDFLRKVERTGGCPDAAVEILLNDRKLWIERVYSQENEKKNIKIKVTIGIGLSFLICAMSILMLPKEFDITDNLVSQVVTAAVVILNLLIWYTAQRKLSGSLILMEGESDSEEILQKYNYMMCGSMEKEKKKSLAAAVLFLAAAAILYWKGNVLYAVLVVILAVLLAGQPRRKYKSAMKRVKKEVEKQFPEWLMNLSLQLQTDNVHVSLEKTIPDAPEILKDELNKLLEGIEQHPNSLKPYIGFMEVLKLPDVFSAMKLLYSMAEFGTGDMGKQIDALVQRNIVMMDKAEKLRQEDIFAGIGFLVLLPMVTGVLKMLADLVLVIFNILSVVNTI